MRYTKELLIEQLDQGQKFEYLLFYGHKASADGSVTASCLSQWFPARFEIDGVAYLTAEHYMMAEKARIFEDTEALSKILNCKTPKEAKALGRKVRNFDPEIWETHCSNAVVKGNQAKFLANSKLADWLVATAPKVIVEASPYDRIWGIGMNASEPSASDPKAWLGKNLLGFALMEVRDLIAP